MKKSLLVITACIAFSSAAFAAKDEPRESIEFMGGYMKINTDGTENLNGFNLEMRKLKNEIFGYGGSINYGYANVNGAGAAGDISLSSIDGYALIKTPTESFYVYGKAGLAFTGAEANATYCTIYDCYDATVRDNDINFFYGFGVNVPLRNNWLVDVSYTKKEPEFNFGGGVKGKTNLGSLFVQIGYQF